MSFSYSRAFHLFHISLRLVGISPMKVYYTKNQSVPPSCSDIQQETALKNSHCALFPRRLLRKSILSTGKILGVIDSVGEKKTEF